MGVVDRAEGKLVKATFAFPYAGSALSCDIKKPRPANDEPQHRGSRTTTDGCGALRLRRGSKLGEPSLAQLKAVPASGDTIQQWPSDRLGDAATEPKRTWTWEGLRVTGLATVPLAQEPGLVPVTLSPGRKHPGTLLQ